MALGNASYSALGCLANRLIANVNGKQLLSHSIHCSRLALRYLLIPWTRWTMFSQQSAYPFHIFFTVYWLIPCKLRQTSWPTLQDCKCNPMVQAVIISSFKTWRENDKNTLTRLPKTPFVKSIHICGAQWFSPYVSARSRELQPPGLDLVSVSA